MGGALGTVLLVVRCGCGRPWSPPVRLTAGLVARLKDLDGQLVLATTRCRRCKTVVRHTLDDLRLASHLTL